MPSLLRRARLCGANIYGDLNICSDRVWIDPSLNILTCGTLLKKAPFR